MAVVPDKVLSWLHSCLKNEYHYVDHTYYHVKQTLSQYPSLAPRTEIYSYENGTSALLLQLRGTLPVLFRGAAYRFPIILWIPHHYPREGPIAYITATEGIAVRPGQHVGAEGRIYHPYLAHWANHWDKSNLIDFLAILQDVFTKEPPVVSKQQAIRRHAETQTAAPPPLPPPPQSFRNPAEPGSHRTAGPPPPPKPSEVQHRDGTMYNDSTRAPGIASQPVPPPKTRSYADDANHLRPSSRPVSQPALSGPALNQAGPPPPPLPQNFHHGAHSRLNNPNDSSDPFGRAARSFPPYEQSSPQPVIGQRAFVDPHQRQYGYPTSSGSYQQSGSERPSNMASKAPVQDLLSAPLDANQPNPLSTDAPGPAPPIPPNPERDALLHAISLAIRERYNEIMSHNAAAIPALEGQQSALQRALQNMQSEMQQLQQLDAVLSSNEKILHDAMKEADRVIESVSRQKVPAVDDVLVAPTIVGEQLYRLVADERSIADAMFALSRALDKGRIGGDVFIKQTRSLAREQFMKKALIKKIADGMGLDMEAHI